MSGEILFFIGFFGVFLLAGVLAAYANRQISRNKKGW